MAMFQRLRIFLILAMTMGMPALAIADDSGLVAVRLGNAAPWLGSPASAGSTEVGNAARLLGLPGSPWTATLPSWLRWALEPQVQVLNGSGGAGIAGEGYRGLTWSVPLASGVLHRNDTLSFGFSVGQSLSDPTIGGDPLDRRTLSPTPLLRLGAGIAYQVTPRLGLYALFDHQSSSGATRVDDSENDLGIRVGLRF